MSFFSKMHFQIKTNLFIVLLLDAILISSCDGIRGRKPEPGLIAEKNIVTSAERLKIVRMNGYTSVTIINPWQGVNDLNLVYNLVPRGSDLPGGLDSSTVIFVPLNRIICMSTTHVAMISALGKENSISGVSGTGFIFSPTLIKKVDEGLIADVGYEANLNKELILKISPDVIMMYGIGSESAAYVGKIKELGVKVVFNADYLEKDPISKAEWIKFFGALYCKENFADSIFNSELETYDKLKAYINKNISERPKVLLGLPFKDTWYISPGNSFMSKLIEDAGGDYLWKNTKSSISMPIGIENVYLKALTADFWLNIGSIISTNDISTVDGRLTDLKCYKSGNLYNNNKRITLNGGNDYWESGSLYPHLILKDIATILHPDLFSEKELFFYRRLK